LQISNTTTHAAHLIAKKAALEVTWRVAKYLFEIGALEDKKRAYLLYAPLLMVLTMNGRMMQTTSDSVALATALELFAIVCEVFEARDLLRLETPIAKVCMAYLPVAPKSF